MREVRDLKRITLLFLRYQIADAADRMNLNSGAMIGKLLSETKNIGLHRIGRDVAGKSENMVFDILFRHHAALTAQQDFQHRGFSRRKHAWLAVDKDLMAFGIVGEIGEPQRTAEQLARTTQDRLQPRHQFLERKRLDQIVVGACSQAIDAVVHAVARGQHQHRQRVLAVPDRAQDRQAVAVRQTKIEDQGGIADRRQGALRLAGIVDDIGLISRGQQPLGDELGELDIVLDNQKSHVIPSSKPGGSIDFSRAAVAGMADPYSITLANTMQRKRRPSGAWVPGPELSYNLGCSAVWLTENAAVV